MFGIIKFYQSQCLWQRRLRAFAKNVKILFIFFRSTCLLSSPPTLATNVCSTINSFNLLWWSTVREQGATNHMPPQIWLKWLPCHPRYLSISHFPFQVLYMIALSERKLFDSKEPDWLGFRLFLRLWLTVIHG